MADCLFCAIAAGEIPADVVARTDRFVAFRDIAPQAPVHVLVIPVVHHANASEVAVADAGLAGELIAFASQVAAQEGVGDQYRLVMNTGADAGQSVFHVHAHVLGGRPFGWPPG